MGGRIAKFLVVAGVALSPNVVSIAVAQSVATDVRANSSSEPPMVSIDVKNAPLDGVLRTIARQAGLKLMYGTQLNWPTNRVTMRLHDVSASDAFAKALAGTGLKASISTGIVAFARVGEGETVAAQGTISGTVTDAKTKQALRGVKVSLGGAGKTMTTDDNGAFQFPNVAVGSHTITVRMLGYVQAKKTFDVSEGQTTSIEIPLQRSVSTLDQVVVTGTVVPTELRAVPNAITVVTAKQLEERGITRIEQLFRGDIPGLFAQNRSSSSILGEVTMFSRGATALGSSAGTFNGTNPIKTYLDGIEMADSKYLSQIDPRTIERIEILTGPQASTIYGSNALNGVMQIFTKRGTTSRPKLTLNLQSGWIQNDFTSALTPLHDYAADLTGIEGRISYSAGSSWNHEGSWNPGVRLTRMNVFGAGRIALPTPVGTVTGDISFNRRNTHNQVRGDAQQSRMFDKETGMQSIIGVFHSLQTDRTYDLNGQAWGLTMNYTPTSWWSHGFVIGQDAEDGATKRNKAQNNTPADTVLGLSQSHNGKRSLRYTTTALVPVTPFAQATITLGADTWQSLSTIVNSGRIQKLTGELGPGGFFRQTGHNTGGFLQAQIGFWEQLFFTYGLRAEWNPDFGDEALPTYAPRYGVVYTTDIGPVTAKFRASYGRSTRPPQLDQKTAIAETGDLTDVYGPYNNRLANPNLGPEHQQGGEGGIELYLGSRASLVITRYNQTVDGLITNVPGADSVRSLKRNPTFFGFASCADIISWNIPTFCSSQDPDGYAYALLSQNLNVASIRNQGWELQGSVTTGPVTTRGTYSWTKSRTIGVTPEFRKAFASELQFSPQYRPGATFSFLPEHTWALGVTYAHARTMIALNVTGTGLLRNSINTLFLRHLDGDIRLLQNRWIVRDNFQYMNFNRGYALADINASRQLFDRVETVLQIQNLTNRYPKDQNASYATMGRQTKAGVRIRM